MKRMDIIKTLESIEKRVDDFPNMTASDWSAIDAAKKELNPNSVWHDVNDVPEFNSKNGCTELIIDSLYGHIEKEAHHYTPEQWSAHIGFMGNMIYRWAYEKDLIDFDD